MTLSDFDTLRADTMRGLLNEQGRGEIWKYDIMPTRAAVTEAAERDDFDNLTGGVAALRAGQPYALVGPGICDHYFATADELVALVTWLCTHYLGAYAAERCAVCGGPCVAGCTGVGFGPSGQAGA